MENYMKLEVPAKSCNEAFVRAAVSAFAVQLDLSVEELADIKTAVSEAVTNSIVHGYKGMKGIVNICCRIIEDVFEVEVVDYGVGIENVGQAMQPLFTTDAENERSGMGFTVMETFTDELSVASQPGEGTVVTMKKRIRG